MIRSRVHSVHTWTTYSWQRACADCWHIRCVCAWLQITFETRHGTQHLATHSLRFCSIPSLRHNTTSFARSCSCAYIYKMCFSCKRHRARIMNINDARRAVNKHRAQSAHALTHTHKMDFFCVHIYTVNWIVSSEPGRRRRSYVSKIR